MAESMYVTTERTGVHPSRWLDVWSATTPAHMIGVLVPVQMPALWRVMQMQLQPCTGAYVGSKVLAPFVARAALQVILFSSMLGSHAITLSRKDQERNS